MTRRQTRPITVRFDKDDEARLDRLVKAITGQYEQDTRRPAWEDVTRSSALRDFLKMWDEGRELPTPPQVEAVELAKVRRAVKR